MTYFDSRYVDVDTLLSYAMGAHLRGINIAVNEHPLSAPRNARIWMELLFTSICHQTNWDKLHCGFVNAFSAHRHIFFPESLAKITDMQFSQIFGEYCSASGRSERAGILRGIGKHFFCNSKDISELVPNELVLGGDDGLYRALDDIEAFSEDPLRKKARVFVHQLLSYGLVNVTDPSNIAPAIDYHLIRLYVRTGRVIPTQTALLEKLTFDRVARVEFQTHLRRAVENAMWYTASASGLRVDQLNYVEWQIARSFCTRKDPRCHGPMFEGKLVSPEVIELSKRSGCFCPNFNICLATVFSPLLKVEDPQSNKAFY